MGAHGLDVLPEALGEPDAADVEARAEGGARDLQLGRAPADVDDERPRFDRPDPAERQVGLLVAGQEVRREPVAPLDLTEERLSVLGVPNGARGDAERPLRAEPFELAPIVREDVAHTRDRGGRSRRRSSTPSPSRVITSRRTTSLTLPLTSATRRRVEFVPRSTAATLTCAG